MWEYELMPFQNINGQQLAEMMNEMGRGGWEYCGQSAFPVDNGFLYCYIFKRPSNLVQRVMV
jgi:hypothetical protein